MTITLESNRLAVEIADPGAVYTRTRFDWTGFITQVTLDGQHTFCVPEDYDPAKGTGGIGLCNEFGNELAVGYAEAKPGEAFLKLGIGLLQRPDEGPYNFFRPHQIVERFPIRVEASEASAVFTVEPIECRGYAARLQKTISVAAHALTIQYTLENTGSKPIVTHEYAHNFLGIDRLPIGPDYRLRFPQAVQREPPPEQFYRMAPAWLRWLPRPVLRRLIDRYVRGMSRAMALHGQEITWRETPQGFFFSRLQGFSPRAEPQWHLVHVPTGLHVSEADDFPPARLVVWGAAHVVSAEVYIDLSVPPGGRQRWQRRYEFERGQVSG
jgi:hypothetical protein